MLGHAKHHLGRLPEARVHLQRSLDIDTEKARLAQVNAFGYDRRVDTLGNLANTLWLQGFPEQARLLGLRALEQARPLQFALPVTVAEARYEVFTPVILAHLCESAIAADRYSDALSLMAQIESRDRNKEHWCTAEILRVKGLLALSGKRGQAAAADLFSSAAALARKQGALAWELRAAMNLSKLWVDQGRERKALGLLEPLYSRFTEGFETVDLIAALRLLDELRQLNPTLRVSKP